MKDDEYEVNEQIKERLRISSIIMKEFSPIGANGFEVLKYATKATICARKIMGDWKTDERNPDA
jgi:hypothetical protein